MAHAARGFPACSVSEELLDENDHLVFLNSAWAIFIEGLEDFIESFIREIISWSEVTKGINNEFFGLFLIEGTALVDIIFFPDLVNDTLHSLFFSGGHGKKFLIF